jgi:hypothetical protein
MASATAERTTEVVTGEVVDAAEKIVAAAAAESKTSVPSQTTEKAEARAWDAKAQID